jgi:RNA polymerase sigma-70 factor (family 1)
VKRLADSHDIQQLIKGNESTFNFVYALYSKQVYNLAFRFLKEKELSEEVVQETFINLWISRKKLDANGNLWLYIYVIAKRLSLNTLREIYKSESFFNQLIHQITELHNGTEEDILGHELEKFTTQIIQKLPKQQQLVFKMSRVDGLTHNEIALRLQISPNTVKNHIGEALKTIKADLKRSDLLYFVALIYFIK